MRALTRRYRWPIERREFAANGLDGRVAWVSMCALPAATISGALSLARKDGLTKLSWLATLGPGAICRLMQSRWSK